METTSQAFLEVENVAWGVPRSLKAGDPPILQDLTLQVPAGRWIAITGPSGSGKTTLLSICAGLLRPTGGRVSLFGRDLAGLSDQELTRLRGAKIGLVFQNYHLDDSRSALENILLPGYFGQSNWHELTERARRLGLRLDLEGHLQKPASVLSGGQRQRVAVCRALLNSPRLILADEPTGALDQETADLVLQVLKEQVADGASMVTVTHDSAVLSHADLCLAFENGRLREMSRT